MLVKRLSAATCFAITAGMANAGCGEVTISEMDWASSMVVTEVAAFLMEQGYGCSVTRVPSSTTTALASVAETGEPNIVTEVWANSAPALQGLLDSGKVIELTQVLSDGGVDAWFVPKYLVDEHPELATLEGVLDHPEWVGGRFNSSPEGWGSKTINDNLFKALDMKDKGFVMFVHGSAETLGASLAAAYEAKEPWFGFYWGPTPLLGRYPMVAVDMGPYNAEIHACNRRDDCPTPGVSAYPPSKVSTIATEEFVSRQPEIADLMSNLSFTNDQMSEVLAWQDINSASSAEAAVHFLTTYKDSWSAWLNEEARTNLSPLLK